MAGLLIGLCGFLSVSMTIPLLLIIAGLFQGAVRPSLSAMIIDFSTTENRKSAFSLSYLGINIGVAIGPMFAGLLFESHLAWVFWIDALTTAGAVLLVAWLVPESHPDHRPSLSSPGEAHEAGSALAAFFRRPILVIFSIILLFTNFMYEQIAFGLPIYNSEVFGVDGARWFGTLMSVNAMTVLIFTLPLTWLTRQVPVLVCVGLGAGCYALGFGMLAFRLPLPLLILSTTVWTWGEILFATNVGTWLAAQTPQNHRGRFGAIQGFMGNTGYLLSPLLGGLIIRRWGVFTNWALIGGLGVAVTAAIAILYRSSRSSLDTTR